MPFTEDQTRGRHTYHYRVQSVRDGRKVSKKRVYLGKDLSKADLRRREREADQELGILSVLLTPEEERFLDGLKASFAREPKATRENRYEAFLSLFTYDSNAIEGNTLTLEETSQLLFDGLVPQRSLREIREALNHKQAFDHLLAYRGDVTKAFICRLHEKVVHETLRKDLAVQAGKFRTVQVFIRGVEWVPPKAGDVPNEMRSLLVWYAKNRRLLHPLVVAAYFHIAFELVHPFVDGNGRVGRLLLNFILYKAGLPMINIPLRRRREYYAALHEAQVKGRLRPFLDLLLALYRTARLRF